jgi:hypothetical protein
MASTYLTRTPSSTGNRQIFTFSAWVKRSSITTSDTLFYTGPNAATSGMISLRFTSSGTINVYQTDIGSFITTNRLFRDTSAWYHIVLAIDTTQATPDDRRKLYINGVQETSFSTSTEINRNLSLSVNTSGQLQRIGTYADSSGTLENQFNGSMSYVALVDGTAELPTIFGETDSVTGQWKIKTDITPSVAWGTNGFLILKNGNSLTDESTNTNNFTLGGGTLTNTLDCPDNVFATMNSLDNFWSTSTYANGNNTVTSANNGYTYSTSTFGVATGKWYWEIKWSAQPTGSSDQVQIGIAKRPAPSSTTWLGQQLYTYGYQGSSGHVQNNNVNASGSVATPYSVGDIISVAMDLDNNKIHFAKNGAWTNSSDPAANSGGVTITAPDSTPEDSGFYFAAFGDSNVSLQETGQFNFGNGFFGTSAVADNSTATASTPGTFNYDVPTGYQPLSTKGLNA